MSLGQIAKRLGVGRTTIARAVVDLPLSKRERRECQRQQLKGRPSKNCGRGEDLTGRTFGRLVVTGRVLTDRRHTRWACECSCGNTSVVRTHVLLDGTTRSCGCLARELARIRQALPIEERELRRKFYRYRRCAINRGLSFELSKDEARQLFRSPCWYCGAAPHPDRGSFTGIDRRDNTKGYVAGNVVACCSACNYAKMDWTEDEFIVWALRLGANLRAKASGG